MTAADEPSRTLVDTNVVVYAYDPGDLEKHQTAMDLLRRLSDAGLLIFSAQIFNEFSNVLLNRRRERPATPAEVAATLRRLAAPGEVVPLTAGMTLLALDAIPRHGFSFWDALVWAAARENGATVLYTEDFQHGREVEGVRIVNPFVSRGTDIP
ncbi:PIN domain-containing protein [Tautonia plasticadhaerens]|uniref:Ribonuclease VapC n=1 Tax=Tautonia plasticadhaerens TaxID=2527974 RepID=A0A518H368_9BACT|nr:PIN domain-containing protein [Tautonia plasticadhaerens]QDV35286.1 tRNA(fMet)-specific endonuclease VapC [Tautonia plasticadhaerens]